jgi:endonuclease/exonuclease/phosphatase family metal-dependent hydrolase
MKKMFVGCRFFGRAVLSLSAAVFIVLNGCSFSEKETEEEETGRSINLMTWNVHNLFDGKDNGYEYDEFRESAGWSAEKYLGRINVISAAIGSVEPKPDIIVLQEIESLAILEDLARSMPDGYSWSHFANNHGAALGLGILSRLPLSENKVHSITIESDTTPRPVLETRIQTDEGAFVIFACHWKSKLGGDDVTENIRRASARVILRRIRELWENEPETGVIVTGDLNENHDEFYRREASVICALLPDDPYSSQLTGCFGADSEEIAVLQKDFIVLSRNKPPAPVNFPQGTVVLFSPWISDLENGSYFYKHNWETIDHFLISGQFFNGSCPEYERVMVVNNQYFSNAGGIPVPYNERTGTGLSDHLPLLLVLKMMPK